MKISRSCSLKRLYDKMRSKDITTYMITINECLKYVHNSEQNYNFETS